MPVRGADYEIIAAFSCPVCGSSVKAHGFRWECLNRKHGRCWFTIGRKWKRDPEGQWFFPNPSAWGSSRERYREKHGDLRVLYDINTGEEREVTDAPS